MSSVQQTSSNNQEKGIYLESLDILRMIFGDEVIDSEIVSNTIISVCQKELSWDEAEQVIKCLSLEGPFIADSMLVTMLEKNRIKEKLDRLAIRNDHTLNKLGQICVSLFYNRQIDYNTALDLLDWLEQRKIKISQILLESIIQRNIRDSVSNCNLEGTEELLNSMYELRLHQNICDTEEYRRSVDETQRLFIEVIKLLTKEQQSLMHAYDEAMNNCNMLSDEIAYKKGFKDAMSLLALGGGQAFTSIQNGGVKDGQ